MIEMVQDTRNLLMAKKEFSTSKILNFNKDAVLTMSTERFVTQNGDSFSSISMLKMVCYQHRKDVGMFFSVSPIISVQRRPSFMLQDEK